jgi:hypothetical protein
LAEYTELNSGSGGDKISNETLPDGTKMPVSKITTGTTDTTDGPVHRFQPFPVVDIECRRLLEEVLFTLHRLVELQEQQLREGEPSP